MTSSATLGDQAPLLTLVPPSPDPGVSSSVFSDDDEPAQFQRTFGSAWRGAVYQVLSTLILALLIAMTSGLFTLHFVQKSSEHGGYTHVPFPKLKDPRILRYLGGMGPYIGGHAYEPPPCEVTQLHVLSRHGERFPTTNMARAITQFAQNISNKSFHGNLKFLERWKLDEWIYEPEGQLNQETLTGPAAGSVSMFRLGTEVRSVYPGLFSFMTEGSGRRRVWSTPSQRVIDSAKYFARGFFGLREEVEVQVIPTTNTWANTLTPSYPPFHILLSAKLTESRGCPHFINGDQKMEGNHAMQTFHKKFIPSITERLNTFSDNYSLTDMDILVMSWICPYELNSLGYSNFCDVFTIKEWKKFDYARDLAAYYESGPGNMFGKVLGRPWVESLLELINRNHSSNGDLYFSFSHDTDIVAMVTALGIFPEHKDGIMRWDKYSPHRPFKSTSIVPMAGHILIERLQCSKTTSIRIIINNRIQEIPNCISYRTDKQYKGVYPVAEFEKVIRGRWNTTFCEMCDSTAGQGQERACIDRISFYDEQ